MRREWHRKRLAKRLLAVGSVDNLEQNFLQRLKGQCGAQFTQKMEGMCNDLQTARQKQQEYAGWREGKVRRPHHARPLAAALATALVASIKASTSRQGFAFSTWQSIWMTLRVLCGMFSFRLLPISSHDLVKLTVLCACCGCATSASLTAKPPCNPSA